MPIVRAPVLLTLYAAGALCLSAFYFLHYPVPGFFQRLREIAAVLGFVLTAAAAGRRIRSRLGLEEPASLDEFLWSVGTGMVPLVLGLLALGLAGGFRPSGILLWTAVLAVLSRAGWGDWFRRGVAFARGVEIPSTGPREVLLAALCLAAAGTAFLCALAPPTYYDSLVYHLALPAGYLREGRIGFVPYNHYSHFPQNMELIFGWFLALGDDVSAQLFNVFLAVLTGGALFRLAGRLGAGGGKWALALFAAAPCTLLLSSETYVETPMAFWTTLSLWAAAEGISRGDRRRLLMAGILSGFAAGIKYTGVLTPALLSVLVAVWPGARSRRDRFKDAAAVAVPAFLLFLPWLVKNWVFTGGNPVFPFLPGVFPARNVYMYEESAKAYFQVLNEYQGSSGLLTELFLMPFRLATNATSFGGGYDVTGDLGWALPIILLPLGLLAWGRGTGVRFLWMYVVFHVVLWAGLRPVLRFLYPVFPSICLLAGAGFSACLARVPGVIRRAALLGFGLFLLSGGVLFYVVERVRDPLPAALGLQTREEYLRRKLDAYRALEFCGRELPAGARLLFVGDQRGYYSPRSYLAPMALLPQPLRVWADEAGEGEALRRKLTELGFTHLFFHRREAERLESYRVLDLTPLGRAAWDELLRGSPPEYADESVTVHSL